MRGRMPHCELKWEMSDNTPVFASSITKVRIQMLRKCVFLSVVTVIILSLSACWGTSVEDRDPSWSPDGSRIAFTSYRDGNWDIYVMDADGSNQQRLTDNPAVDRMPSWSADGSRIAFVSGRDGNWDIYVMDADGSNQQRLTDNVAPWLGSCLIPL